MSKNTPELQHTLRGTATTSGIALHTGERVRIALHAAAPDTGVRFRRTDLPGQPEVHAVIENVTDTRRGTTITEGAAKVVTVEHLLAAFSALGVDNVLVHMSGPEPPIMDGSSKPFADLVLAAGLTAQDRPRRRLTLAEPVFLEVGGTRMIAIPDSRFRVCCTVKFGSTFWDCQYLETEINAETFLAELCEARTFCLYHEIEPLMAANLIRGGSLDNAVVIKGDAILSKEGLRYPDELVRHKTLDIVGDLYLLGGRIDAQVIAIKPGHPANVALAHLIREKLSVGATTDE